MTERRRDDLLSEDTRVRKQLTDTDRTGIPRGKGVGAGGRGGYMVMEGDWSWVVNPQCSVQMLL